MFDEVIVKLRAYAATCCAYRAAGSVAVQRLAQLHTASDAAEEALEGLTELIPAAAQTTPEAVALEAKVVECRAALTACAVDLRVYLAQRKAEEAALHAKSRAAFADLREALEAALFGACRDARLRDMQRLYGQGAHLDWTGQSWQTPGESLILASIYRQHLDWTGGRALCGQVCLAFHAEAENAELTEALLRFLPALRILAGFTPCWQPIAPAPA